jgi:dihydroorotate dehydrogenase
MYSRTLRPLLFYVDPEIAHHWAIIGVRQIARWRWLHAMLQPLCAPPLPALRQELWGMSFAHPVGLAAGFDKNAEAIAGWPPLGFAYAEVGTITALPQPGNPCPRLFRLPADEAILNRYGFNNDGARAVAERLARVRGAFPEENPDLAERSPSHIQSGSIRSPLGINLGKSKLTPPEEAANDYLTSFQLLYPYGDYFVVNVSSPNTPGLRQLQSKASLRNILQLLQHHNPEAKPLLVKIAPDLSWGEIDDVLEVATDCQLAGAIATNTTTARTGLRSTTVPALGTPIQQEAGGISGPPLRSRSTQVVAYMWKQSNGQFPIVGVGGIDSVEAAWEKIVAGASLLQLYTGLVYQGPGLIARIARGLDAKLTEHGLSSIREAVGLSHR